ncbi:hypothetical protein G5714_024748 [Onychostoma macrolepis]|uniref:Uncharacterized protein n=1 Tax=Onychostoma macrolepis TaxID=369639 RepID=A0A7J6BK14_9TELE|nr:hypothetical protein G5714_024748 [Onychostoma macrolepis]
MFVPLYSFGPRAVNTRRQRPRPPFALALRCHGQACPAPSFGGCRRRHFGIGHVYKTWHAASPCPPNSAAIASVRRVQPQQPSTCTVCGVEMARGPHHLGESSQEREGYRYLERASSLVLATAAHILKLDRYRED